MLETVGLIAKRNEGRGYYDRFRDRVIFPIRDVTGRIVGFGGRILPSSPVSADRPAPKYYNSAETPIFSKSDKLYGIDLAKQAAAQGRLPGDRRRLHRRAHGPPARHRQRGRDHGHGTQRTAHQEAQGRDVARGAGVRCGRRRGMPASIELWRFSSGASSICASRRCPQGLDPCDLLSGAGAGAISATPWRRRSTCSSTSCSECWAKHQRARHGRPAPAPPRRCSACLALSPSERSVKMELMVNRIAQRLLIKEETVWARFEGITGRPQGAAPRSRPPGGRQNGGARTNRPPALPHERELLEVLLAEPALVAKGRTATSRPSEMRASRSA